MPLILQSLDFTEFSLLLLWILQIHIHHISSMDHASFNPVTTTPCSTPQTPPRPVCRCLSFSSADNYTLASTPVCSDSSDEEEDFQMVPWMMNTGLPKKHLKELFVSMNMDYHITYANTHVLMRTITLFHTWTVWI